MPWFAVPQLDNGVLLNAPSQGGNAGDAMLYDGAGNLYLAPSVPLTKGTNKDDVAFAPGQVCAVHSSGIGFVLANATDNSRPGVGLALANYATLAACAIQISGTMQLGDWTLVTGTAQLSARSTYWLDVTSGRLTNTPPATRGNVLQVIGRAVALDTLLIEVLPPILL